MLLKYWETAVHDPRLLIDSILGEKISEHEKCVAVEVLGYVSAAAISLPVIQQQLDGSLDIVKEPAMFAIRVISIREPKRVFPVSLRDSLVSCARNDSDPTIRQEAASCLADLVFEHQDISF